MSKLTKHQTKELGPKLIAGWGNGANITATIRFDDNCGNGHNSFSITGEIRRPGTRDCKACGMLHDEIGKAFPEILPLLKWHLMSTDGPMHYISNARYWAGLCGYTNGGQNDPPNLEHLKSTIVYGALPEDSNFDLSKMDDGDLTSFLVNRLPALLEAFKRDVFALGFEY